MEESPWPGFMARFWSSDNCSSLHSAALCTNPEETSEQLGAPLNGELLGANSPEHIVHAHNAVGSGGATVVHDGGVALHPHPSSVLG